MQPDEEVRESVSWGDMACDKHQISTDDELFEAEEEERRVRAANRLPELRLVLLGWRWPGKSLTGNTILGREEFRLERAAEFCVRRETEVCGRRVTVVDTPGWFSSQATPNVYQQEMLRATSLCPPGPHAFLLVIPVGMFTEGDRVRTEEQLAQFGENVWSHTLLVFAWAPSLRNLPIERHIRREGRDLQLLVQRCHNRYHVINNDVIGEHPQLEQLMEKVEKIVAEQGGLYVVESEKPRQQSVNGGDKIPEADSEQERTPARDLGARPKHSCRVDVIKTIETGHPQKTGNGEATQTAND